MHNKKKKNYEELNNIFTNISTFFRSLMIMATVTPLDDITECPICTEVYTDPRSLPCVHTYCLKCLETYCTDKQPGDQLACPLCRKEFTLPSNGVRDLPKNFFVGKFLQMKKLSSVESKTSPCEACSGNEESGSEVQNFASVYCVECQMKFCQKCERVHKTSELTRSHKLFDIGDNMNVQRLYQSMPPSYCDQHNDEKLKIYCFSCKVAICTMCYFKSHNGHKCSDVNEVENEFRKRMKTDGDSMVGSVEKCREMLHKLKKEKDDFNEQVEIIGMKISEKAEQLKQMIDDHKEKLMSELSSMQQKRTNEIESLREEIEIQLMSMESYKKYVDEVRQKGTACDIARAASGLHDRADELLKFDVIERTLADLGHADVTLKPSISEYAVSKSLGQLRLNIVKEGGLI